MSRKQILSIVLAASVSLPSVGYAAPVQKLSMPAVDAGSDVHLASSRTGDRIIRRGSGNNRNIIRLFPRQSIQRQSVREPARPAAPIRKIRGPSFFNYTAVAVAQVPINSLLPDMTSTGSIAAATIAAQSSPLTLPPMTVLDSTPPPIAQESATTVEAVEQAEIKLPEMTVLSPEPPRVIDQTPAPALTVLEAAPVRLASVDLFAVAAQTPVSGTIAVEDDVAAALRNLYAERQDFIWSDGHDLSERAQAVLSALADAGSHGLNPAHYAVDVPQLSGTPAERASQLIAFDVELSARGIRYAMDLKDGFIEPNKISGYHDFGKERLTASDAAKMLADTSDVTQWYADITPQQSEYRALQNELASLQGMTDNIMPIPSRIMLRPGDENEALPAIMQGLERRMSEATRQKHEAVLAAYDGTALYDEALVELVRDVQRDLNLKPDGIVGPMTAARLAAQSVTSKIDRVTLALERMRWHPEAYGDRHVVINAPEYRVRYKEGGEVKLSMRAIVGKKSNQTYFFHDEIETVVFNPYWGVPQSIIVNSYLPKLRADPSYLDRNGFVVTTHSGKRVSSSSVNWYQFSSSVPYNVRQKPGPRNALGELKILFPNKHAIYMHDTPARNLFQRDARAYSHGCVRLEDPRAMAAAVLGKDRAYVESQLGGYEKGEKVSEKIPVWVSYFTAWPDDNGTVQYHPDVYDRDVHLKKAFDKTAEARSI